MFASLFLHEKLKWQYFAAVLLVAAGICVVNKKVYFFTGKENI